MTFCFLAIFRSQLARVRSEHIVAETVIISKSTFRFSVHDVIVGTLSLFMLKELAKFLLIRFSRSLRSNL